LGDVVLQQIAADKTDEVETNTGVRPRARE
jgi:hypothetical protein